VTQEETSILFGAWTDEEEMSLSFPADWNVHVCHPKDSPPVGDEEIKQAFRKPVGSSRLKNLAAGKKTAVIAVDDITRPTPVHRFLPTLIQELMDGGIHTSDICILIGTAAHRPMTQQEIVKKLSPEISHRFKVIVHDFMGSDIRKVGWIKGGPVYLNQHFLNADLRVCVGGVIPHKDMGFGGGAKMVVPGVSGYVTIAHLHGALPPRHKGRLDGVKGKQDCRAWAEEVARNVGVDAVVCAVINSRRQLSGLYVGDLVQAHRAAARKAAAVGQTDIPSGLIDKADIAVVNSYPLDTDAVQMGRSLHVAKNVSPNFIIVIHAASDGICYHGMGLGCGVDVKHLIRNISYCLFSTQRLFAWLGSMKRAIKRPNLIFRLFCLSLNNMSYSSYLASPAVRNNDTETPNQPTKNGNLFLFSPRYPAHAFSKRYPSGLLFREWQELFKALSTRVRPSPNVLLFPCAPLQILNVI
jgi:nickel-dependent lactate racemase